MWSTYLLRSVTARGGQGLGWRHCGPRSHHVGNRSAKTEASCNVRTRGAKAIGVGNRRGDQLDAYMAQEDWPSRRQTGASSCGGDNQFEARKEGPFRGRSQIALGGSLRSQKIRIFPAKAVPSRKFAASSPRRLFLRARWLVVRREMGGCFRAAKLIKHYQ